MSDIHEEFRTQMKERMDALGINQRQLAKELAASGFQMFESVISRIVHGGRQIKLDEGIVIAGILKMDLTTLVKSAGARCPLCHGEPPDGFVCGTCGRRGGAR